MTVPAEPSEWWDDLLSVVRLQYDREMAQSLEQRIQRLEDRFAIDDLIVQYATLLDDARWDELGQLFTHDGVFGSPHSTTVGREAVIENFKVKHAPFTWTLHDPHGRTVEIDDDDHARGVVIGYAELGCADYTVATSVRYLDDYRREDGRWRFARRNVLSVYGAAIDDIVGGGLGNAERKRWPNRASGVAELPDYGHAFHGYPGMP